MVQEIAASSDATSVERTVATVALAALRAIVDSIDVDSEAGTLAFQRAIQDARSLVSRESVASPAVPS